MSSYVGFHCYKISSLFEDLASMNKTWSISVGLNSHACNGQDIVCVVTRIALRQRESESQHNNTHRHSLSQESGLLGTYDTIE